VDEKLRERREEAVAEVRSAPVLRVRPNAIGADAQSRVRMR